MRTTVLIIANFKNRKDFRNHLVYQLHFTYGEMETQKCEGICPSGKGRKYSKQHPILLFLPFSMVSVEDLFFLFELLSHFYEFRN